MEQTHAGFYPRAKNVLDHALVFNNDFGPQNVLKKYLQLKTPWPHVSKSSWSAGVLNVRL